MAKLNWNKAKRPQKAQYRYTCDFCGRHHIKPGQLIVCHDGLWGHPGCLPRSVKKPEPVPAEYLDYARQMRENMTPAERRFFEVLTAAIEKKPVAVYRKNLKVIPKYVIDTFVVDFYMPQVRLAIETGDGCRATPEMVIKDNLRDTLLRRKGITVIRFPATQSPKKIERNVKTVMDIVRKLRHVVGTRNHYGRKRRRSRSRRAPPRT